VIVFFVTAACLREAASAKAGESGTPLDNKTPMPQ